MLPHLAVLLLAAGATRALENGTFCEEMTVGEVFSQLFNQFIVPTPPAFEGFQFPLDTNQVLLIILGYLDFRDKGVRNPPPALKKERKIIQIILEAGFVIKKSKEIQFLGVKWQDGQHQIPTEVINKITAMSPPTSKKETQAFLGTIGFWRMHIPEYSQIVSPLYPVTHKNDFHWGPEQQQAFAQIKQEIAHAVALGPVRTGPDVKNVLYSAAGNNGLSWSLWQKVPGETRGRPVGLWS
ncbi:hypothetical protein DUI87_11174 [Hirundo rustica rustica]|uniref:Reverse transcriptase/retrotransposon-derived protein RNase H-like domain-containing protein n=1 Tax=Hirundo rustica rustica TaxID=333673 RepID=A0A3M0KHF8_HIRRU|nr:hypothetical protein DUI87_11174 [Hirundo rustica rustica]